MSSQKENNVKSNDRTNSSAKFKGKHNSDEKISQPRRDDERKHDMDNKKNADSGRPPDVQGVKSKAKGN